MPLVDLDDPVDLRARWSALAAVAHATGYDRRWWADEIGWHHEDPSGNDLRMVVMDDDRAVLFGYHVEYSRTGGTDLLGGAPEWIAQPEVRHRIATGELGFVYGQFSGTWARAGYPGDPWQPIDDGFMAVGSWLTSDEETAAELVEWAAEWADYLGSTDQAMSAGLQLVQAAGTTGISSDHLLDLFDLLGIGSGSPRHPDLAAALHAAAAFGGPVAAPPPVQTAQPANEWEGADAFARLGLMDVEPQEVGYADEQGYYQYPEYADQPYDDQGYYAPADQGYYAPAEQPAPEPYVESYTGPHIEDYDDLFADSAQPPAEPRFEPEPTVAAPSPFVAREPVAEPEPPVEPPPVEPLPVEPPVAKAAPDKPPPSAPPPSVKPVEPVEPVEPAARPAEAPPSADRPPPIAAPVSVPVPPVAAKANGANGDGRGPKRHGGGPAGVPEQQPSSKLVFPSFIPPLAEEPPVAPAGSLEAAMRAERERSRPRQARTEAEELLHEWCLARTRVVPSGFTIEVQALDPAAPAFSFDLQPPPVPGMDRIAGLLRDLWRADAHTERGGWLFARIDAAGRTLRIDRWYDQIPPWWEHDLDDSVDVPGLLRRLGERGSQWRPSYLNRLPADAR